MIDPYPMYVMCLKYNCNSYVFLSPLDGRFRNDRTLPLGQVKWKNREGGQMFKDLQERAGEVKNMILQMWVCVGFVQCILPSGGGGGEKQYTTLRHPTHPCGVTLTMLSMH